MSRNLTRPDAHIPPDLIGLTRSVTPEQFERLCQEYSDLRLELTSTGELIVMPGTGFKTGVRNANLTRQLGTWAIKDGSGVCCDSSTIFALPNEARRSPDASWVKRDRLDNRSRRESGKYSNRAWRSCRRRDSSYTVIVVPSNFVKLNPLNTSL